MRQAFQKQSSKPLHGWQRTTSPQETNGLLLLVSYLEAFIKCLQVSMRLLTAWPILLQAPHSHLSHVFRESIILRNVL